MSGKRASLHRNPWPIMILFKFLVSSFLLITAHAVPSRIESRVAHRKSRPAQLIKESTDTSNVVYSNNWGGIVLSGYPPVCLFINLGITNTY